MRTLYHSSAYDASRPAASFWEASVAGERPVYPPLGTDKTCDIAVIGGGYTGLSCALHLARDHHSDVCVLEAAQPGWGASGRNGGFCCMGSTKLSYAQLVARLGLEQTRQFLTAQREAVTLVRDLARDEALDIDASGSGEIRLAHKPSRIRELREEQRFLAEILGLTSTFYGRDDLLAAGLAGPAFYAGLHNPAGFGLHPLKYAIGLAAAAARRGAQIHGSSPVQAWTRGQGYHRLHTPGATLSARRVVIATNGYTSESLHPALGGRLLPVLSNIIVTRPLTEDEIAAQGWRSSTMAYDTRTLLHYFRLLPDGRFLFGGRGGLSAAPANTTHMQAWLTRRFQRLFPAWSKVTISHFWRGLACLAYDRLPHIGALEGDATVFLGLAYHGNGVAMASWAGRTLARMCAGADQQTPLPALLRQAPPRFPLPFLRLFYLRAAYSSYHIKDRLF